MGMQGLCLHSRYYLSQLEVGAAFAEFGVGFDWEEIVTAAVIVVVVAAAVGVVAVVAVVEAGLCSGEL